MWDADSFDTLSFSTDSFDFGAVAPTAAAIYGPSRLGRRRMKQQQIIQIIKLMAPTVMDKFRGGE